MKVSRTTRKRLKVIAARVIDRVLQAQCKPEEYAQFERILKPITKRPA